MSVYKIFVRKAQGKEPLGRHTGVKEAVFTVLKGMLEEQGVK
jgi:hypothetical protein